MVPLLDLHDVTVAYDRRPVLWDVDFVLREPRLVGVVGPNGAGKSTLLNATLGLVPLTSGSVEIFGEPLARVRQRVGYVPQRDSIDWEFPVSVLDVVLMGSYGRLGWFRRPGSEERRLAQECIEHVGLESLAHEQIGQLTEGQRQRALVARAMTQRADIYFMEEPMADVDPPTEHLVASWLAELQSEGKSAVVVHHDLRTAPTYFDQVLLLNMRLVASGPIDATYTPDNLQKTFGARLDVLETAGRAFQAGQRTP